VKVLAEISAPSPGGIGAGTLRRHDLEAFDGLLEGLGGAEMVLVTGAADRKREAAVGLAAAAAASGRRTALLECDLAAPRLAASLGLAAAPGLHEYLRWESEAGQVLQALSLGGPGSTTATEPLVCIVAGKPTDDGQTLLASESFRHATERLRGAYELVVLDGPPLEPDPARLHQAATHADVAIACLERSDARGRASRRLKRDLRRLPTRFAGAVAFS
jgi:Mrp family chromosome partitioning ATPase